MGCSRQEVEQMIAAALVETFKVSDPIAIRSFGNLAYEGKYLCAEQGGPPVDGQPFVLTARSKIEQWETWILVRGVMPQKVETP